MAKAARDLLVQVPVEAMADRRIQNPAAFAAWSVDQLREQAAEHVRAGESARERDVDLEIDSAVGEPLLIGTVTLQATWMIPGRTGWRAPCKSTRCT